MQHVCHWLVKGQLLDPLSAQLAVKLVWDARLYAIGNARILYTQALPFTGGLVLILVDSGGMNLFLYVNPGSETLLNLLQALIDSGFISAELTSRCEVDVQFTSSGSIQVTITAWNPANDSQFCYEQSQLLASNINGIFTGEFILSQILQFSELAVYAPVIIFPRPEEEEEEEDSTGSGSGSGSGSSSGSGSGSGEIGTHKLSVDEVWSGLVS